jgi:hypothetical protein
MSFMLKSTSDFPHNSEAEIIHNITFRFGYELDKLAVLLVMKLLTLIILLKFIAEKSCLNLILELPGLY